MVAGLKPQSSCQISQVISAAGFCSDIFRYSIFLLSSRTRAAEIQSMALPTEPDMIRFIKYDRSHSESEVLIHRQFLFMYCPCFPFFYTEL